MNQGHITPGPAQGTNTHIMSLKVINGNMQE